MSEPLIKQILQFNNVKNLSDLSKDKLQRTMDEFNRYTMRGGNITREGRQNKHLAGEKVGWTAINESMEITVRQRWFDEVTEKKLQIPIGARKVTDTNRKGKLIIRKGRKVTMTFEYREVKGKPRWVTKTWRYTS